MNGILSVSRGGHQRNIDLVNNDSAPIDAFRWRRVVLEQVVLVVAVAVALKHPADARHHYHLSLPAGS